MKRQFLIIMMLSVAAVIMPSCTKDGNKGFKGNYTFKTGGYVTLSPVMTQGNEITLAYQPESGQMDILDNGGDGKVLVTMNILSGAAVVIGGTIKDDILTLDSYSRIVTLMKSEKDKIGAQVTITGTAKKIDNIIIFDMSYTGYASIDGVPYMISSSNIEQIAKEN